MTAKLRLARLLTGAAAALALGTALAGCGSTGSAGAGAAPTGAGTSGGTGTSAQQRARGVWLDYARCVRAHGYPNFPDPVVGPDGNATLTGGPQAKQAAVAEEGACGAILGRLPASVTREPVTPALLRTERLLAACLRQHGLPQWPDPRPDGTFPLSGTPYATTGKSGLFLQAMNACRQYATNGIQAS
jgi:hypothetical protein